MNTATATKPTPTAAPAPSGTCFTCQKPSGDSHCCPVCEAEWNAKAAALPPFPAIDALPCPALSLDHFTRTVAGIVTGAAAMLKPEEFAHFTADLIGGALLTAQDRLTGLPPHRELAAHALAHAQGFADLVGLHLPAPAEEYLAANTQELHDAMTRALKLPKFHDDLADAIPWRTDPLTGKTAPVPACLS